MSNIVQQALEEAIETRDEAISILEGKLNNARNGLHDGIVFVNNQCKSIGGQREILDRLNQVRRDTD